MMKREQIFLSKNFTVIESDIPFTLKFNIKDNTANSAEDVINFKSGWYIFDNNKLLPQYVDGIYNLPKYNCWIEFDETLGAVPNWYTCYINPKSVESLSAEQTELDPAQLALLRQDIQINGAKVDSFAAATHSDLGAVKTSVDTLQISNHSDLGAVKTSVDTLQISNHSDLGAVNSSILRVRSFFGANSGSSNNSYLVYVRLTANIIIGSASHFCSVCGFFCRNVDGRFYPAFTTSISAILVDIDVLLHYFWYNDGLDAVMYYTAVSTGNRSNISIRHEFFEFFEIYPVVLN